MISLCILLLVSNSGLAANILGIFNHPGASHTTFGKVLLKNLARKGHNVTVISAFPLEKPLPNYRDINLVGFLDDMKRREMMYYERTSYQEFEDIKNMSYEHTDATFTIPEVKQLIASNETFDVVIADYFLNEATWIFGHIFNTSIILLSPTGNNFMTASITGNSMPFSYVPQLGRPTDDNVSLYDRVCTATFSILWDWMATPLLKAQETILSKHFENPPSLNELRDRVVLVLTNSHFSLETVRPYTPNVIPVGGMHIEDLSGLSEDLQSFLDNANEGVIYFSLGSQLKSSNLKKEVLENLLKTFSRLKVKVLWKFENDNVQNLPKNVKTLKWFSQLDVLAHKNVKIFITHTGMLSMIESIHFGKPMICIPNNGDQISNTAFVVSRKLGLKVDKNSLTGNALYEAIIEILNNPRYEKQAKFHSSLLREQPLSPIQTAIYWVEHIIKHKTGHHLQPFSKNLPWYKYYMIDVIGVVLVVAWVTYLLIRAVLKFLYRGLLKFLGRNKNKTD